MFKELERKLIRIYTITTGVILTLAVTLALFVSFQNTKDTFWQTFHNNFNTVSVKLQKENIISSSWIAAEEDKNQLVVGVEENGKALQILRSKENQKLRKQQLDRLRLLAAEDGIDTALPPVSVEEIRSRIYQWEEGTSRYYGQVMTFKAAEGYRSLLLVEKFSDARSRETQMVMMFLLIDLLGILLLYGISVWFVRYTLKPVKESKERQDQFVAAASHELRAPLAVIKANLSLLKKSYPAETETGLGTGLEQIDRESNRMARLIHDMLLLASVDAGSWKIEEETVEIENLLIETYESWLPLCREKGMELVLDLQEEEMKNMRGDKERLKQVFSILIENALRFSKEGDEVVLRGRMLNQGKRRVLLEVEDHGSGIPDEKRELIFERFYQEDSSRSDKNHFGLGLSIARQIVTLQQGMIVCRETKGGGATFSLYFLEMD